MTRKTDELKDHCGFDDLLGVPIKNIHVLESLFLGGLAIISVEFITLRFFNLRVDYDFAKRKVW